MTRYAYLRTEEGIIQRFRFRVPQRIYFEIVCDLEELNAAIEIMALKARQLGISIFSELLITHRICFSSGVHAVIASADQSKTSEMSKMLFLAYDKMPVWIRPTSTSRVESDRGRLLFSHMATGVSFQHGSQKFGIATGSTPTIYHISEVALFGDSAVKLVDEGLWKAVHASDKVLGILESTGRGNTGWWADTWRYSKSKYPHSRMFPMFLPWYCGVDIYPMPADQRTHPIPPNWYPDKDTREHVAKAALYVRSSPLLRKHLIEEQKRRGVYRGGEWQMPIEQQWYWEWNHLEAKYKGVESSYLQEMAGDDEEALQRSTESVFGHETIQIMEDSRKKTYDVFGLSGQSIEDDHEPPTEDIDYERERTPVRFVSNKGEVFRWELIPLRFRTPLREDQPDDSIGKLFVFHHPKPGHSYSIGVDTSEGKGEDSTSIEVWDIGGKGSPDVQAAEFASPYVSHVEAFSFVLCIAAYYGQYMETGVTRWKQPYVSVEQVAAVGDTVQLQMRRMGYTNFHRMVRYDSKNVAQLKRRSNKQGWFTWGWSRPILTGNFVHCAKNGWAVINSPWLLHEMKHFEVTVTATGKEKMEHEEGEHDDRIFGSAMAVFCPHDMDIMAERSKKRSIETDALPYVDIGAYGGGLVLTADDMRGNTVMTLEDVILSGPRDLERWRHG